MRLKKCLYGADFSGKSWNETLDNFLQKDLGFHRSRVEACLYIYQKDSYWLDDALYYANNDNFRMDFELLLKKRCNLTLMGEAKWYLGMRIRQGKNHIMIDQDQYVKNIDRKSVV